MPENYEFNNMNYRKLFRAVAWALLAAAFIFHNSELLHATTVSGTVYDSAGNAVSGAAISFRLINIGRGNVARESGTSMVTPALVSATSAADGTFRVTLVGNDAITPAGTLYEMVIRGPGFTYGPFDYSITGTSADLDSLTPVASFPNTASQVASSQLVPPSGCSGSQVLQWTGTAWICATPAASPGGSNGQVQVNNGGAFGGAGAATYDSASGYLTLKAADSGGQVFSCRAFGCKGDGSTDDTAAIQNTINAAAAVQGTALIPPSSANYIIASFLSIPVHTIFKGEEGATLEFTGNGGGACTAAQASPVSTGLIRFPSVPGGSGRIYGLKFKVDTAAAGTCLFNLQDGGETSSEEIDHNEMDGAGTGDTNTAIYSYSNDTISIHDNIIKQWKQMIVGGNHTWANINISRNVISTGENNSLAMLQTPSGANCFQVSISFNVFEGFGSTNGINSTCTNGLIISGNYMGDSSATGGDWISGASSAVITGNYIDGSGQRASGGHAINGAFSMASGNYIYGQSLLTTGGTLQGNNFLSGPAAGCFITMNQGAVVESIRNNFTTSGGAANSYCHANSLTPHPIVRRINDTDSTTSGVQSGVTAVYMAKVPATFSAAPACNADAQGNLFPVTDSTTNSQGATITGGGVNSVLGYCNGTNWVVTSGTSTGTSGITQISQNVLAAPAASVTFSSIPGTYSQLMVVIAARASDAALSENCSLTFNGDSTANYDTQFFTSNNTSNTGGATAGVTAGKCGSFPAGTASANVSGEVTFTIPDYAGTTFDKAYHDNGTLLKTLGTTSTYITLQESTVWRSTAAINSITLTDAGGGNWVTGSTFTLYGIQ